MLRHFVPGARVSASRLSPLAGLALLLVASPAPAQQASERVDTVAINRIKREALERSQVMDIMSWLTDVYGPRLTNSPTFRQAGDWAVKTMKGWGLQNATLETWGPFGRGWINEHFHMQAITPQPFPVIAYPQAWTVGTAGPVTAEVVMAPIDSEPDFAKWRGKLRGKWVMTAPMREVKALWQAPASRYTDAELTELATPPDTTRRPGAGGGGRRGPTLADFQAFSTKRQQFYVDEGVAGVFAPGRGDGGTVFVQSGGSRQPNAPPDVPKFTLAIEHYGRMARALERGVPVKVEVDARNRFIDGDLNSFNVVAEIPGTDPRLKDEVVMLGGHFDSWHGGTGATDNAAGSAVMMEAMRILKTTGVPLKRTVRIALWGGEEQGLLGSRQYVTKHFGDTAKKTPEHAKFSSYFNVDNGTGKIRGVYLQGNEAVRPVFQQWMAPFRSMGMTTLTIRNTGGTDHQSFDRVGLPGFQFIQDEVEYSSRTHHSNMDTYERIQADDMKHNAAVVASFVFMAANREALLPRKGGGLQP